MTVLELRAVSHVAAGARLLDGVDLAIGPAERVAVLGGSGSGKSLLAALAIGLAHPLSGVVRLLGVDLAGADEAERRHVRGACGVTLQGGSLLSQLSVEENLRLAAGTLSGARLRRRLDRLLFDFAIERTGGADVGTLSRGERARVELARAFVRDPAFVILDEPCDGVRDGTGDVERALLRQIAAHDRALLLLTQDEGLARRTCHRLLRLERGRLVPADQQPAPAAP